MTNLRQWMENKLIKETKGDKRPNVAMVMMMKRGPKIEKDQEERTTNRYKTKKTKRILIKMNESNGEYSKNSILK